MDTHLKFGIGGEFWRSMGRLPSSCAKSIGFSLFRWLRHHKASTVERGAVLSGLIVITACVAGAMQGLALPAHAAPAPEVEYVYDVTVRRHYNFANPGDAIDYGHQICDKVGQGESYAQVMAEVKGDVVPNDEFAANYLVSYAVNLLCPAEIWQLRKSAAGYRPPAQ